MFSLSSTISAYPVYRQLTPELMSKNSAKYSKSAAVQQDITYFRQKLASVKTPDDFLKDYRLLKFALTSFGLEDQLDYPARIKTIIKDDAKDPKALVNRMTSAAYKEINAAFAFAKTNATTGKVEYNIKKLQDAAFVNDLVEKYKTRAYEQSLGSISPNITEALYFERNIGKVKNAYEIIGDKVLFNVVKTSMGASQAAVGGKIERLKAWIEREIDMKRLNDKAYVKSIAYRFLALKDVEASQGTGSKLIDMFA